MHAIAQSVLVLLKTHETIRSQVISCISLLAVRKLLLLVGSLLVLAFFGSTCKQRFLLCEPRGGGCGFCARCQVSFRFVTQPIYHLLMWCPC